MGNTWFLVSNILEIDIPLNFHLFQFIHNYRRLLKIIESNNKNELDIFIKNNVKNKQLNELCLKINPNDGLKRTIFNYIASYDDFSELLELILKNGNNKELVSKYGVEALVWSIRNKNTKTAKLIIDYGCNINEISSTGTSALHEAAASADNIEILQYLLDHNVNVDIRDKTGRTPLHIACDKCDLDVVKKLVQHGCNVNLQDSNGWTVMHIATGHNDIDIVKYLVVHGAGIHIADENGQRPITWARFFNSTEVHKYLTHIIKLNLRKLNAQNNNNNNNNIAETHQHKEDAAAE